MDFSDAEKPKQVERMIHQTGKLSRSCRTYWRAILTEQWALNTVGDAWRAIDWTGLKG